MLTQPTGEIRIGDTARFPLGRLGEDAVYRYRWEVQAFRPDGSVVVRRLHDGVERTLAARWIEKYGLEERYLSYAERERRTAERRERARRLQGRRTAEARADRQTDPAQPGFYVSARKGPKYALLCGPFRSHYSALTMVRACWTIVREYDDPWCEVGVGTCRVETSEREGKFNARVFA